jgi:hypothetical protein
MHAFRRPILRLAGAAALLALTSACVVKIEVPETVYSACHVLSAGQWTVRIEQRAVTRHRPPHMKPMLIIDGIVTVPAGGYDVGLDLGPVQKLHDPIQQILVRTTPSPDGGTAPVAHRVHGEFLARKKLGSLLIRCGDGTLALIRDLPPRS